MASEIRVNKIENRSGLGTVTFADTGVDLAGIVTATTFSGSGASLTALPAAQVTGTLPAISGANLTNLSAANLTGTIADARFPATLPAASAANLTSIPAANVTGTLPALTAANLTNIPAANIVGLATAGFERSGGFATRTVSAEVDTSTGDQYYAFTGIDTTIKRFDVLFRSYSNTGANDIRLQLGNSGGYATSGYHCGAGYWRDSTSNKDYRQGGFDSSGLASESYFISGRFSCVKINVRWHCEMIAYTTSASDHVFYLAGYLNISNLDRVRFGGDGGAGDGGAVTLVTYSD